jgi:hypothetical protein
MADFVVFLAVPQLVLNTNDDPLLGLIVCHIYVLMHILLILFKHDDDHDMDEEQNMDEEQEDEDAQPDDRDEDLSEIFSSRLNQTVANEVQFVSGLSIFRLMVYL